MRLTDKTVASLPQPERGQKIINDDAIPGFGVRVGSKSKVFILTIGVARSRITIGRYPIVSLAQAREKARTILAQKQLGLEEKPTPFFKEVFDAYLREREKHIRISTSAKDGYIAKHFDRFADRRLAEVTPQAMQNLLDSLDAPWTRHYTLRIFAGFIKYAQKRGHIDDWPIQRLEAPLKVVPRERTLSDDELRKLIPMARVWTEAGHQLGTLIEVLILTGQRRQQIGSLRESEVDFENNMIVWPPERMKSNRRHVIPLGKAARAVLEHRPTVKGLYFPNQYGSPFSAWSLWYQRFMKDWDGEYFTLHDLRRSFATAMQRLGVKIEVTERLLAHRTITGGLVGIYQKYSYMSEMNEAISLYEEWIASLA